MSCHIDFLSIEWGKFQNGLASEHECYQFSNVTNNIMEKPRGDAGIWTRGLLHAKQALYRWATSPMSINLVLKGVYALDRQIYH